MNSAYLKATRGNNSSHVPIWFMRQAGRYMSSFQKLRQKYSFLELIHTPELAAEVTMQPIDAFGFDAAIIFSDILVMADLYDLDLSYIEGQGPRIGKRVYDANALKTVTGDDIEAKLGYVTSAIRCTKELLAPSKTPLIGFCGAPFTVASYMVGEDFRGDGKKTIKWCMRNQEALHGILEKLADASIEYLKAQVKAGADALQIFESWNSYLSWKGSEEFSVQYIKRIIDGVKATCDVPITVFGTANSNYFSQLVTTDADVIAFDSKIDLHCVQKSMPAHIGIQGNLDPHFLFGSKAKLIDEVDRILDAMEGRSNFIFNLGHGVLPETPEAMVALVVDRVKKRKIGEYGK